MKKSMKQVVALATVSTLTLSVTSCGGSSVEGFDSSSEISVVSREDGSGTRDAFTELFGILVKDGDSEVDNTYEDAIIANKTDVVMTNIGSDEYAIGYISLGSLNDSLKSVDIDGVDATDENIILGDYPAYRPFLMVTDGNESDLAKDFESYIMSSEGQEIVSDGYIAVDTEATEYTGGGLSGKLSVGGSTSVSPVMEKLVEGYQVYNPDVIIDIQATGSSAGITGVEDGTLDIGMSSRDLDDEEATMLTGTPIAYDGIAVVVNNENPIENLTSEQVREIFTGEVTTWEDVE